MNDDSHAPARKSKSMAIALDFAPSGPGPAFASSPVTFAGTSRSSPFPTLARH
jgi:hypothetical protein